MSLKGWLRAVFHQRVPEYTLTVTRDEAIDATDLAGQPISPKGIDEMLRLSRDRRTRMLCVAWILANYDTLRDGYWPEVRVEEIPSHGGRFKHSWQEVPIIYAAEWSKRVEGCGADGEACWNYYRGGQLDETMAPRIERALRYCATWSRRNRNYRDWCNRNYSRKAKGEDHNSATIHCTG